MAKQKQRMEQCKSQSIKSISHHFPETVLLFLVSMFIEKSSVNDLISLVRWFLEPETLFRFSALLILNNLATLEQFFTQQQLTKWLRISSRRFINHLKKRKRSHRIRKRRIR